MNILLVNPPIRLNAPPYIHPIGLAIVASMLRNAGHAVTILDLNVIRCQAKQVTRCLPFGKFDWIGVSGLITTYRYVKELVPVLRTYYGESVPIVLGGGGFSSAPEVYFNCIKPDYGVIGEGEYTALEITEHLASGKPNRADIAGLMYSENGRAIKNRPRPLEPDLDKFPLPAFDLLLMEQYAREVKYAPHGKREIAFFATRGCPWECTYCYHLFRRGERYRSTDHIIHEIEYLRRAYQMDSMLIADECLTANRNRIRELCRAMIERKYNLEWMCYSRADTIDEETLDLMKRAGCFMIGFGLESGSQKILNAMNKCVTPKQMLDAIQMARKYMRVSGTMIFGYPGETDATVEETLDFCAEANIAPVLFFLQPYPGTRVFQENQMRIVRQLDSLDKYFEQLDDAGKFVVNLTDWDDDEVQVKLYATRVRLATQKVLGWKL